MCSKKISFASAEKELIVSLIRERPIIEDKRTNAKNIELKKQAWEDLASAFNSQPYVSQRTSTQLKRCWENIKSLRKKELSQEAASLLRTGGGPPEASCSDNTVDIICPFINLKVPNVIDSNSIEIPSDLKDGNLLDQSNYTQLHPTPQKELLYECTMTTHMNVEEIDENMPPQTKRKFIDMDTPTSCTKKTKGNVWNDGLHTAGENEVKVSPLHKQILKENSNLTSGKALMKETEERIKRTCINTQHDQELFELRLEREKIMIQRERNTLEFEKIMHKLQIEKLQLEINKLKQ